MTLTVQPSDNGVRKFLTLEGAPLNLSGNLALKRSYILQRYRDVWSVLPTYPYLFIDELKLNVYENEVEEFPVFFSGFLVQNVSKDDFIQRMISSLASPGTTGGFSATSNVLVEGRANPKANSLVTVNDPLYIGMHPYAALGTKYVYFEHDHLYQHTIANLIVVNKYSRPHSTLIDFDRLADLQLELSQIYFRQPADSRLLDTCDLERRLDEIFVENIKILLLAEAHHKSLAPYASAYDYEAPVLTKYGRLTHDPAGVPRVEISYSLLHYETALREFDNLKRATLLGNIDAAFAHGVSCVVSTAACLEAIANKLVFIAEGVHPTFQDRRKPLSKINDSCEALVKRSGTTFVPLSTKPTICRDLDELRKHRNKLMHASELESDLEPMTRLSLAVSESDETKCRSYLMNLRLAVEHIFLQFPNILAPIETRKNVIWLGDMEVP